MKTIQCPKCHGKGKLPDPLAVAAEMKAIREKTGLTMRQVAGFMGISVMYLSDMEAGRRNYTDEMRMKCMDALAEHALEKETR